MNTAAVSPPQLTTRAVVLAIVLAMVLAAANTYLGLFAGMTIASAIPAAVVSMAVLRVLGGSTILENNIVQTGASAGSSIASGVIFTIPALVILGHWADFQYMWVLAIAGLGGILGVFFSVPLRRALIVDQGLAFPEGKAAAEVLKTGENPPVTVPPPVYRLLYIAHNKVITASSHAFIDKGIKVLPLQHGGILELIDHIILIMISNLLVNKRRLIIPCNQAQQFSCIRDEKAVLI